jgi:hypothetical protein
VDAKLIPPDSQPKHVLRLLDLTPFGPDVEKETLIDWARLWRGHRDTGDQAAVAAAKATQDFGEGR